MRKLIFFLLLLMTAAGCSTSEMDEDYKILTEKMPGGGLNGIWRRVVGASGDETDIAIGVIHGEPSDRVYMCEFHSSVAGLYKGTIKGSTVTWDAQYGLPDYELTLKDPNTMVLDAGCSICMPTDYVRGSWRSECGPI